MLHGHEIEEVTKTKRQKILEQYPFMSHLSRLVEIFYIIQFKAGSKNGKIQHNELTARKNAKHLGTNVIW